MELQLTKACPLLLQILELLADHMRQWACHIAFPELVHIPLVTLRSFVKSCSVERFRRSAKQLVDAIERNITWVGAARDGVSFAPQDIAAVGNFLKQEDQANKVISSLQYLAALCLAPPLCDVLLVWLTQFSSHYSDFGLCCVMLVM